MIANTAICNPKCGLTATNAINIPFQEAHPLQQKLYKSACASAERKFGILYDKIYRMDILQMAWEKVSKGKRSKDKQEIKAIQNQGVEQYLRGIQSMLREKSYQPQPVRRKYIPKPNGGYRPIGIPTIKDRVIQTAAKIIIEPIFEADFMPFSYGYRPNRNAREATKEVEKWLNKGYHHVITIDLEQCFDNIPHDKLIGMIRERVTDKDLLKLIGMWLKCGYFEGKKFFNLNKGTPQGGVISPLLANIYLNAIDHFWASHTTDAHLIRYADDIIILCRQNPQIYYDKVASCLKGLNLNVNAHKSRITHISDSFDFLGFTIKGHKVQHLKWYKVAVFPSEKAVVNIIGNIEKTIEKHHADPHQLIGAVNAKLIGWHNYFNTTNALPQMQAVDHQIYALLSSALPKGQKRGDDVGYFKSIGLISLEKL